MNMLPPLCTMSTISLTCLCAIPICLTCGRNVIPNFMTHLRTKTNKSFMKHTEYILFLYINNKSAVHPCKHEIISIRQCFLPSSNVVYTFDSKPFFFLSHSCSIDIKSMYTKLVNCMLQMISLVMNSYESELITYSIGQNK